MLRKGEIRGYAVYYRVTKSTHPLSVNWVNMDKFTGNYTVVYTPPVRVETDDVIKRLTYELTGLYKFMDYTIHLTAYTKVGTGPWTFADYAKTDEDGNYCLNALIHVLRIYFLKQSSNSKEFAFFSDKTTRLFLKPKFSHLQ